MLEVRAGLYRIVLSQGGDFFIPHDHKYIIADDEAVQVLLDKMLGGGTRQKRREKLLKALDEASRHYEKTNQKERQAFFHGLLTGYAVALKLL